MKMLKSKAQRKFTRRFNRELGRKLGKKMHCRWELIASSEKQLTLEWSGFKYGESDQAAITPVKIGGTISWAVASTYPDEGVLGKFLLLGPFTLFTAMECVIVTFWKQDPRSLAHPIDYYRMHDSKKHECLYVFFPEDLDSL